MSRWEQSEKREKQSDKESILNSMVVQSGENVPFFLRFLFWYCFRVVWSSPGMVKSDKILGIVLYVLFWKWLVILRFCGIFVIYGFDYSCLGKIEGVFEL